MSLFITFEGPDGCGKTTISNLIYEKLLEDNYDVVKTREPGGTKISEKIRGIILSNEHMEMHKSTEALLYAASRAQHVNEFIIPSLNSGKIVLCERFVLSSLAYQGIGRGVDLEDILKINEFATKGVKPDIVFLFRIKEKTLNRKDSNSLDRLEKAGDLFHKKVRDYYNTLELKENYYEIDASLGIEEVLSQCMDILKEALK